jgi:hypothetical protein
MPILKITEKTGLVRLETLFKGSKSEGLFPVLITEDGEHFRIHIKGNQSKDSAPLANLDGQKVCLAGYVDDIKGHIRIVIDADLSLSVKVIGQNIELDDQLASRENQQAEIDKNNIKEKP